MTPQNVAYEALEKNPQILKLYIHKIYLLSSVSYVYIISLSAILSMLCPHHIFVCRSFHVMSTSYICLPFFPCYIYFISQSFLPDPPSHPHTFHRLSHISVTDLPYVDEGTFFHDRICIRRHLAVQKLRNLSKMEEVYSALLSCKYSYILAPCGQFRCIRPTPQYFISAGEGGGLWYVES